MTTNPGVHAACMKVLIDVDCVLVAANSGTNELRKMLLTEIKLRWRDVCTRDPALALFYYSLQTLLERP